MEILNLKTLDLTKSFLLSKIKNKYPLEIFHEVNFSCNLRCKYCGIPKTKIKEMNAKQIKNAIKEFTDAGTITWNFTGGEPLLRKDIQDLINCAKDHGIVNANLVTNGIFFKKKLNGLKKIDRIYFSLDGPKEIHEKIRGTDTYEKVVDAIKLAKKENFNVTIQTVICKENVSNDFFGLRFLFKLAENIGVKIMFHPLYAHRHNKNFIKKYLLSNEKNIEALKLIKKTKKQNKFIGRSDAVYGEWIKRFEGRKTELKNYAGIFYCFLFPDGKINSCLFKENGGIDGLKQGFVTAFENLKPCDSCKCISFLTDRDILFSSNFEMITGVLKS